MSKAASLAQAHWDYVRDLLSAHFVPRWLIALIGFHYKSAFVHGYKHAKEENDG